MTKQCEIVKDLLPLYADEVCSESSAELVKEHLKNCPDCLECYNQMCSKTDVETLEKEKAEVIKRHEKKEKKIIRRKILVLMLVIAIVFPIICHAVINIQYKHILQKPEIIDYNESKIFTQQEIDGAIKLIKKEWAQYDDLKIVEFRYCGDKKSETELQYWNETRKEEQKIYEKFIVIFTEHLSLNYKIEAFFTKETKYRFWTIGLTYDGVWKVVEVGTG